MDESSTNVTNVNLTTPTEIHIKNKHGNEFIYSVRHRDVAMATLAGLVSRYGVFPVIKDEHGNYIELDLRLRLITNDGTEEL